MIGLASAKAKGAPNLEAGFHRGNLRLPTDPTIELGAGAVNGRITQQNRTVAQRVLPLNLAGIPSYALGHAPVETVALPEVER